MSTSGQGLAVCGPENRVQPSLPDRASSTASLLRTSSFSMSVLVMSVFHTARGDGEHAPGEDWRNRSANNLNRQRSEVHRLSTRNVTNAAAKNHACGDTFLGDKAATPESWNPVRATEGAPCVEGPQRMNPANDSENKATRGLPCSTTRRRVTRACCARRGDGEAMASKQRRRPPFFFSGNATYSSWEGKKDEGRPMLEKNTCSTLGP